MAKGTLKISGVDSFTAADLAPDSVDSSELVDGSVDLSHMSVNSVDSDQYVDGSIDLAHMSANSIDSTQYVDGSIDTAHFAAGAVDAAAMGANSVDSSELVDGGVDLSHMSVNSIDSDQYVDGSIDGAHIADDAITADKIADDQVNATHIGDDVINSEHYADGSIDNAHIADDAIDSEHYAAGSIDTAHIGNLQITTALIADDAVTGAKIENSPTIAANLTVAGTTTATGLLTTTAGIVETGGVLKENLLTNSGFDVWSNSTLENVGSDLVTNGDFELADNWGAQGSTDVSQRSAAGDGIDGGSTYSWRIETTGTNAGVVQDTDSTFTVVKGKLYRVKAKVKVNGGSKYIEMGLLTTGSTGRLQSYVNSETKWHTHITTGTGWEDHGSADGTILLCTLSGTIRTRFMAMSGNIDWFVDDFSCYEVTPGCVDSDTKAPDGWGKNAHADHDLWRVYNDGGTNTHLGSFYSLKQTTGVAAKGVYQKWQDGGPNHRLRFNGRTVTMGAWVKCVTGADKARLLLYDGSSRYSDYNAGTGWEWLEVTWAIGDAVTTLQFNLHLAANATAYWSQPMLVFGSSIGEGNYSKPAGEIIYLESNASMNDANANLKGMHHSSSDAYGDSWNLERETQGALPSGIKAIVNARMTIRDSGSSGANVLGYIYPGTGHENSFAFDIGNAGLTLGDDDVYQVSMNNMSCIGKALGGSHTYVQPYSGLTYGFTSSTSSSLDVEMWIRAIQLH